MAITALDLHEKCDLRQHANFYMAEFVPTQKHYQAMSFDEKNNFCETVRTNYYGWLQLNDEIIQANERILELLTEWIQSQQAAAYLSNIANQILQSHRDPIQRDRVNLDPEIRRANQDIINQFDIEQEEIIRMIQLFAKRANNPNQMQMPF